MTDEFPNSNDIDRYFQAALDGKEDLIKEFIDKYPNSINCWHSESGTTVLTFAICLKRINCVSLLLVRGADPDRLCRGSRWTPLHTAVTVGSAQIVKILLEHGAAWDRENDDGDTPLEIARHEGLTDIVAYLEEWIERKVTREREERQRGEKEETEARSFEYVKKLRDYAQPKRALEKKL